MSPAELRGVPAGRLVHWRTAASEWSDEDRAAFEAFIDARMRPAMVEPMASVRARQEALRKSPTLAGAFGAMWRAGVHPLQDEYGADPEFPPHDFAAVLAVLLRARAVLRDNPTLPGVAAFARDRLEGVLAMCEQHLALPALPTDASLAEWLDAVRAADPLAGASVLDQTWFPR